MTTGLPFALEVAWFFAAVLFVWGLRRLSSPSRARSGIHLAGAGMLVAVGSMIGHPDLHTNYILIFIAMAIGGTLSYLHAKNVVMTDVPQLVALYNGLGGGAAAGIAVMALLEVNDANVAANTFAVLGVVLGCITFAGSLLAFNRLRSQTDTRSRFSSRQVTYLATGAFMLLVGLLLAASSTVHPVLLSLLVLLALSFGVMMTSPISAADMPVLISLYNALTGLAVAADGYVLSNPSMMVAGTLVFTAGALLTRLMARAVNKRLTEIMYSGFGISHDIDERNGARDHVNTIDARDAAVDMAYSDRIVIVPGYGMATSQAQHKLRELTQLLEERGVQTGFAIHPVAGRMPGHMNVLLAEAGVPYEKISDLNQINSEFSEVDVVLVVGASDIVNPAARDDSTSPLFGMPVLEVDRAKRVIVLKRGDGTGYAGIENALLFAPVTRVLFGDAKGSVQDLIMAIKGLN